MKNIPVLQALITKNKRKQSKTKTLKRLFKLIMLWSMAQLALSLTMTKSISPVSECLKGYLSFDYKGHWGISILICQHQREICSHSLEVLLPHEANNLSTKEILALDQILGKPTLISAESSFNYGCCGLPLLFQSWTFVTPKIQSFMWRHWNGLFAMFLRTYEKHLEWLLTW